MIGFFIDQFRRKIDLGMAACIVEPRPLKHTITNTEVERSMNRINNDRASESDELPGKLLKCGSKILAKSITDFLNRALTEQQTLPLPRSHGVLILLSKPGKPEDVTTNLRPTVLIINPVTVVTVSVVGAPPMTLQLAVSTSSCRLPPFVSLRNQACPFFDAVLPPLPLSSSSSCSPNGALQDGLYQAGCS